eukprot:scaffold8704_cov62-Phaeocystis_antarctica.AAC.1
MRRDEEWKPGLCRFGRPQLLEPRQGLELPTQSVWLACKAEHRVVERQVDDIGVLDAGHPPGVVRRTQRFPKVVLGRVLIVRPPCGDVAVRHTQRGLLRQRVVHEDLASRQWLP